MLDKPMESLACPEHICPSPVDRVAAGDGELCAPTVDDQVVIVRPQRRGEAKPFLPHSRQVLSEPDPFRWCLTWLQDGVPGEPGAALAALQLLGQAVDAERLKYLFCRFFLHSQLRDRLSNGRKPCRTGRPPPNKALQLTANRAFQYQAASES